MMGNQTSKRQITTISVCIIGLSRVFSQHKDKQRFETDSASCFPVKGYFFSLNQMLYALCLSYLSNTEAVLFVV